MKSLITFTHSRELNWTDLDNPDPQNPDQLYQLLSVRSDVCDEFQSDLLLKYECFQHEEM